MFFGNATYYYIVKRLFLQEKVDSIRHLFNIKFFFFAYLEKNVNVLLCILLEIC